MVRRLAALLAALLAFAAPTRATIYGQDKRLEVKDAADPRVRELARGAPALVSARSVRIDGGTAYLGSWTYGKLHHLSKRERFYDQPKTAFCSAALIAPDLVLTAGHCIESEKDCAETYLVFDFAYDGSGRKLTEVPASSVVKCSAIVAREKAENDSETGTPSVDWAVIRLERPMPGRPLFTISRQNDPEPGAALAMIGYPSGLPEKVVYGTVRAPDVDADDGDFLSAEIDNFHGNSGSPILDANTLEIVGVLVDGPADFVRVRPHGLKGLMGWLRKRQTVAVLPPGADEAAGVMTAQRIRQRLSEKFHVPDFDGAIPR